MHPTEADLYCAALTGLDSRVDRDVAEDLGIPSSPETFASHIESGQAVKSLAELSATAIARRLAARDADVAQHVQNNHLTHDRPDTAEERSTQAAINARRPAMPWEKPKGT